MENQKMRRLDADTKEIICWIRSAATQAKERLEFYANAKSDYNDESLDIAEEVEEITEALLHSYRKSVCKAISIEVLYATQEFDLPDGHHEKDGSAFPHLQGNSENIDFNESIQQYIIDIANDVIGLPTVPAIAIVDELEEWLNELYEWHYDNSNREEN